MADREWSAVNVDLQLGVHLSHVILDVRGSVADMSGSLPQERRASLVLDLYGRPVKCF